MRDLQMASLSQIARMLVAVAAISAVTHAPAAMSQEFRNQPFPSFYAGYPDGIPRSELETPPKPSIMLAQKGSQRRGAGEWGAENPHWKSAERAIRIGPEGRSLGSTDSQAAADDSPAADGRLGQAPLSTGVYDGLPVDGPPAYRPGEPPPPRYYPGQPETLASRPSHAAHHSAHPALESMPHAALLQDYLELIRENCELKAQLKIQQVEFEAKQRIVMAEHEARLQRHEMERRIADLERMNSDLQAQQEAKEHPVKQTREMFGELQELRRQLVERSHELERVQQSKSELEHRARAFEAQLEQMKAQQNALLKAGQQAAGKQIKKRESERAQKREKRPSSQRDEEHSGERDEEHSGEEDKEHSGEEDKEQDND